MIAIVIVFALLVIAVLYGIGIYNGLVKLRENVKATWSNIDVLLKQRHDEIPKLVDTCKRFMQFEQETLEKVMRARGAVLQASGSGNIAAVGAAERQLRSGIGQIYAVAESYPALKSDATFQHLQQRITGLEQAIADRRELYNDQVNLNNIRIGLFPDSIVARRYGFKPAELLEFSADEKRDVDVGGLFKA